MTILNHISLQNSRRGIAMIELIFALVVMGITLMSAPMLIERATKSSYVALQQESIAAGATQLAMVMTKAWDNSDINSTGEYIPILQTNSGAAAGTKIPNCANANPLGVTHTNGRYCKEVPKPFYLATDIGQEGNASNASNDIDDYNGKSATISLYSAESTSSDYIDQNITIATRVYYGDDTPKTVGGSPRTYKKDMVFSNPFGTTKADNSSTHIKFVTVTLTSANTADELSDKSIFFSAFMCNIGAPKVLESNKGSL